MFRKLIAGLLALLIAAQPAVAQYRPNGFVGGTRSGFQFTSGAGGFPSPGAIFDADWKNNRYAGPPISVSNATGGYIDDSSGNWSFVPPNTARRSDKGLLVEGQQTNSIRNNSMQGVVASTLTNAIRNNAMVGAVAGQSQNAIRNNTAQGAVKGQSQNAIRNSAMVGAAPAAVTNVIPNNSMQGAVAGTPGNQPTGWSMATTSTGLSRQIVGTGVENGIDYIDVRYSGTTSNALSGSSFAYIVGGSAVAAAPGQTWTASAYAYLVGGSTANVSLTFGVTEHDSGSSPVAASSTPAVSATSGPLPSQRLTVTRTLSNANTAFVSERLQLSAASGVAIDFTLRIGLPQLEQSSFAGFPVRTTNGAVTFTPSNYVRNSTMQGVVAGQSQNAIRNNAMVGAVVGSPGTLPNNWSVLANVPGTVWQIVGSGTESGIDFLDVRLSGTATASGAFVLLSEPTTYIAATSGQTWTGSTFLKLQGGSLNNITIQTGPTERTTAGGAVADALVTAAITGADLSTQRYSASRAISQASGVITHKVINANMNTGAVVDVTIRIGSPQLEQSATAGPVTHTTGTAAAFSTGTFPNIWSVSGQNGLSRQIVGSGTTAQGVDYADVRLFGTTASAGSLAVQIEGTASTPAAPGQTWTHSAYLQLVGGSTANLSNGGGILVSLNEASSAPAFLANGSTVVNPSTSSLDRVSHTRTMANASTAYVYPTIGFSYASGAAIDITLRIGQPQIEQAASAGPVVKTNGTAVAAVAGGQLPTNWTTAVLPAGMTQTVVGAGTDVGTGTDYVDVRFQGTASASTTGAIQFETTTGTSFTNGQTLAYSAYAAVTGGSIANLAANGVQLGGQERDAGGLLVAYSVFQFSPTGTLQRFSGARTNTQATTAYTIPNIRYNVTAGQTYDFTLRLAAPQLEQAPGAGPWTRTTGTALGYLAGNIPPTWFLDGSPNLSVVGTGVENGIDYMDVRVFGNGAGTYAVNFDNTTSTPASTGQTWTASAFYKLVGGSLTNLTLQNGVQTANGPANSIFTPTAAGLDTQRVVYTSTHTNPSSIWSRLRIAASGVFDVTIRIGLPQLEQAPGAGPVTKTYGTAAAFLPGTLPTYWSGGVTSAGISRQIVGSGTDGNGLDYLDVRYTGVASATSTIYTNFDSLPAAAAAVGQTWTGSVTASLVSGSLNASTGFVGVQGFLSGGGASGDGTSTNLTLTATPTRTARAITLANSVVAGVGTYVGHSFTSGQTYDFTIRYASPQLEPNATAGTVQRTTGFAAWTAGTLPTNWGASTGVLSRQVVGTGVQNGIEYVDLRVFGFGQSSAANLALNLNFDGGTATAAATGQLWTLSAFAALVAGSIPSAGANVNTPKLSLTELTSAFASTYRAGDLTLGGGLTRSVFSFTMAGASTAYVQPGIWVYGPATIGAPVDFTIRIGWPQLEQWSTAVTTVGGASSPIRTTGTAATRAADVVTASIPGLLSGAVSIAGVYRSASFHAFNGWYGGVSDGTASNAFTYRNSGTTAGSAGLAQTVGGATPSGGNPSNFSPVSGDGTRHAFSFATATGSAALSVDGQGPNAAASSYTFPTLTTLNIGGAPSGNQNFGYIERLAIYPYRAANSNLQTLSNVANY